MLFIKKIILLLSLLFFFLLIPAISASDFNQKFYLIYKQGQLIGISNGITKNNIEKCKTILIKKQNQQIFSLSNFTSETIFQPGTKNNIEIIKHIIESETDSGKIISKIEKKNNHFISTTKIPQKKNIIKKTKVPFDIKIINNNIYYQIEQIISDFITHSNNDFKKRMQPEKNINIFVPAFMKSKKLNLKFITKNQIIAKIDQQTILINIKFNNKNESPEIESFLFPLQLFEVIPCNKKIFDFVESNIIKKIKFNIINPINSGPAKFTISNYDSYNPDEIGSYFYTSFLAEQKKIISFKFNNKSIENNPFLKKIIQSYNIFDNLILNEKNKNNLSINQNSLLKDYLLFVKNKFNIPDSETFSYRNAWGFILLGTKQI